MDCGGPPELRNGRISNTSSMTTTYNSTVKYECDDGFEFDGAIDMSRTCLASGNWSNGEFMCSEFICLYFTPNTSIQGSELSFASSQ